MTLVISALLLAQSAEQGIAQFNRGEYEAAISTFRAATPSPARDAFLGLSLGATNRCAEASSFLEKSYESRDLFRLTHLAQVQCHLAAGRSDAALSLMSALEREFPNDADVLYQSARLHIRLFNNAVARMFEAAPSSYRVNQLSAEILEREGKYSEAVIEYQKAIDKNPKAVNLQYRLGRALLMQSTAPEQLREARRAFEIELTLNPNDAVAEFQIGQILQLEGNSESAAKHFERALALQSDFVEAMIPLARLRPQQSISLLEQAVTLQPRNESARYALMIAYRNAGRSADAQKQKDELDQFQKKPEGEFSEFLKKLGEKPTKP